VHQLDKKTTLKPSQRTWGFQIQCTSSGCTTAAITNVAAGYATSAVRSAKQPLMMVHAAMQNVQLKNQGLMALS
jgi:hypothetical protein